MLEVGTRPYITLFAMLVLVGAYAGLGPALVSLVLGAAGAWYFILPARSEALQPTPVVAGLTLYLVIGAACAFLGHIVHRARLRTEESDRSASISEGQLASMFRVTNVGMAETDPITRRFLRVNQALCTLTGYSEAELLTMTVDQLNHPDDRDRDRELYQRLARGESTYDIEKRYLCKDGRTAWVLVNGDIVCDDEGRPLRAFDVIKNITLRKQAEEERAEAMARFEALVQHAPIGIALFDSEFRFIALNDGVSAMDGIRKADHFGKTLPELLSQLGAEVETHLARVRDTGEPALGIEVAGETPAAPGVVRHWTTNYFPVTDGSARVLGIGAMAVEITGRKLAERALRDTEQRFRTMADSTPVMIWVTDADGNVEFVNRAFREFFGVSEEQVSGPGGWHELLHPDDRAAFVDRFMKAVRDRADIVGECRVRHVDGTWHWIMSQGAPRFATGGAFLGHVGSSPDITERKRAEEALRLKEAHLDLLSNTVPALISYIGLDRRYHSCNQAYTTLLGLAREQVVGRSVRDVTGEEVWEIVGPRIEAALAGNTVEYEAQSRFPNGGLHWIRAVYTPHRDDRGNVIGVITMTTDITNAKHAEQALQEADRRKDEFLAALAHELRHPLAPIRTGLGLLRVAGDKPETLERIQPMMERQVGHMVRLIDDMLDISRIASGKIHLRKRPTSLADVVHDAVEENRGAIDAAGLELSINLPDAPCVLEADATRLVQVLSNLLHNAAKFTDRGGQIAISATTYEDASGPAVALTVRDTGIGIPEETLPHVFDLFVQGDSGDRGKVGLGIGLAVARRLVEMHGGRIDVQSAGKGRGSAFTIRMPTLVPAAYSEPPAAAQASKIPRESEASASS